MQRKLGVTTDGVWGPQTQKAYDRYMSSRMDGVSGSYYPQNENNARMRDVSPAYNQGGSQYQKILGISDPAFSNGDQYVNYAEYLNTIAKEKEKPTNSRSAVEENVRSRLANKEPEWLSQVSSFLPSQYATSAGYNPYPVDSDFPKNYPTREELIAQKDKERQIANSMGAFRQAAQIADEKSAYSASLRKVIEAGSETAQRYGLDSGPMPKPEFYAPKYQSPEQALSASGNIAAISSELGTRFADTLDGQVLNKFGGTLGAVTDIVDTALTISDDYSDDYDLGFKTVKKASGMLGSNIGSTLGTALLLAAGTAIGISTGGLAILAVAGALAGGSFGGDFFENIAQTAYDRFSNPDPEGTAIKMANARYMIDDLAQYANDNRLSSSMPYPALYDGHTSTQSYLP